MKTSFSRSFTTAATILLLALTILGASFQYQVKRFLIDSSMSALQQDAQVISNLAAAYASGGDMGSREFLLNLDIVSEVTDADAVICDSQGYVILCSDSLTGCAHQGLQMNQEYLRKVIDNGGDSACGVIEGLYEGERYVVSMPIFSRENAVGIVIVSASTSGTNQMLNRISNIFLTAAVFVVLISVLAVTAFARRESKPLRDMARAATDFGHGNLEARVRVEEDYSEEVEELALAFNNMASSLQKSEYQRQEFVANVSHELKTPLAAMNNYATLLQAPNLPEEQRVAYAKAIAQRSRQLSRMMTNILKLNKLENQQIYPNCHPYDLSDQLCQSLLQFEDVWESKDIDLDTQIPDRVTISADQELLELVWNNLLSNAFKFTPAGGQVRLCLRQLDQQVAVTIQDTGCGISPNTQSHIFEKFYQGDTSHATQGNGLGLALVRRVVDICQGSIQLTSAPDQGTTFTITLPTAPPRA